MAKGKPWTEAENKPLLEMAEQDMDIQKIYESGKFPNIKPRYKNMQTSKKNPKAGENAYKFYMRAPIKQSQKPLLKLSTSQTLFVCLKGN